MFSSTQEKFGVSRLAKCARYMEDMEARGTGGVYVSNFNWISFNIIDFKSGS